MLERVVVIVGLSLIACSPPPAPAVTPAANPEPAASSTAPEPAPAPAEPAPAPAEPAPVAETKPAAPSIHDTCFAMCDKVKEKCPIRITGKKKIFRKYSIYSTGVSKHI